MKTKTEINAIINDRFFQEVIRTKVRKAVEEITGLDLSSPNHKIGDKFRLKESGDIFTLSRILIGPQEYIHFSNDRGSIWAEAVPVKSTYRITDEEFKIALGYTGAENLSPIS